MKVHSKAPWKWVSVDGDHWRLVDADGGEVADDGSAGGEYSGWFKGASTGPDADAVLMASAPELLETLEEAMRHLKQSGYSFDHPFILRIQSLVAKAVPP